MRGQPPVGLFPEHCLKHYQGLSLAGNFKYVFFWIITILIWLYH